MPNFVQKATASIKSSLSGHKELNQYIAAHKDIKASLKGWSSAQLNASKCLDKWGTREGGDLNEMISKVHELEIKWCETQMGMLADVKASKTAFVSILKQEQAADYADRSSQQARKQVTKAEKTLASLKKKGANTATAETKLRQAQSIYEMCDNEKSSMLTRTNRVKAKHLKRAMVANAEAHLELFRQGIVLFEAQKLVAKSLALEDEDDVDPLDAMLEGEYRPRSASMPRLQSDQLPDRPLTFGGVASPGQVDLGGHHRFASWGGSPGKRSSSSRNANANNNRSSLATDSPGRNNSDMLHITTTANTTTNSEIGGSGGAKHGDLLLNTFDLSSQIMHSPGSIRSQRVKSRMSTALSSSGNSDCAGFSGSRASAMFLPQASTPGDESASASASEGASASANASVGPSALMNNSMLLNQTGELSIFSPARKAPSVPKGISPHGAEPLYADPDSTRSTPEGNDGNNSGGGGGSSDGSASNSNVSSACTTPGHTRTNSNVSSTSKKGHSRSGSTGSAIIMTEVHEAATHLPLSTSIDAGILRPAEVAATGASASSTATLNTTRLSLANASFLSQDTAWAQSAWADHSVDGAYAAPQDAGEGRTETHQTTSVSNSTDSGVDSVQSFAYQNVVEEFSESAAMVTYENVANVSRGNAQGDMIDPYESDSESRRNSTLLLQSANQSPDGYGFHNRSGAATAEPGSDADEEVEERNNNNNNNEEDEDDEGMGASGRSIPHFNVGQPSNPSREFNNSIPATKVNSSQASRNTSGVNSGYF